jgi:nicotinamidase-related amidase
MATDDSSARDLILREDSILVVIDVQEKLTPAVANHENLTENLVRLLEFAEIIGLPVLLTEQEKLGATLPEVKGLIPNVSPIRKITFDCFRNAEFETAVRETGRTTLILTGVEAHVCVAQTALHAMPEYAVHVVSDAVGSRTEDNWRISLEMRQAGAVITSTEMLIFELLQQAGTDEFRATLPLVK